MNLYKIFKYTVICISNIFIFISIVTISFFIIKGLQVVNYSFIFDTISLEESYPTGGIKEVIIGTCMFLFVVIFILSPFYIICALYFSEYASYKARKIFLKIVNILSCVPSIVFGIFGLGFFINFVGYYIDYYFFNSSIVLGKGNVIWAALSLSLLLLPFIFISVFNLLSKYPHDLKEASYALGATKLQTIRFIIIPDIIFNISKVILITTSRALGEISPLIFTGVSAYISSNSGYSLYNSFMYLSYQVYFLVVHCTNINNVLDRVYGIIFIIFILIFILNISLILLKYFFINRVKNYE